MEKTTRDDVAATLNDMLQRLRSNQPTAIFAAVAVPGKTGEHHVRFLMFQQGNPAMGAAVALAVGKNAEEIFGEFDKWMKSAGFEPPTDGKQQQ